jgi:hypothetical protein
MDPVTPLPEPTATVIPPAAAPSSPPPVTAAAVDLLGKLSLADKVIGGAAVVGLLSTFLSAVTVSMNFMGMQQSNSASVISDWRGKLGFLCFVTAGVLVFLLVKRGAAASKNMLYALLGVCALPPALAILLMSSISSVPATTTGPDGSPIQFPADMIKISLSIGSYLFLLAGLGTLAGGLLKAKDAQLLPPAVANVGGGA